MLLGWETKREDFNVCLPREAIKINTSNYQAVLNFLGATSAVRRLYPDRPSPSSSLRPPTLSANPPEILPPSNDETDFAAFTCIYLQRVLQLRSEVEVGERRARGRGSVCKC